MEASVCLEKIKNNMKKAMIGKDEVIDYMLVALICGGHVLLEDVPGLGKTTVAAALAQSINCSFKRIQFTPDVLPSDITGYNVFQLQSGKKEFNKGSILNQIVLADEINRASPKTQSALLEAMAERQVTVEGETYNLPKPFMVLATQNPIDMAGTYPLPEAQLDRFLMRLSIGYPDADAEKEILLQHKSVTEKLVLSDVCSAEDIIAVQEQVEKVNVSAEMTDYILAIVRRTREHAGIMTGCSPRASIALMQSACGYALLKGRDYIIPDDVQILAPFVLAHRIILQNDYSAAGTAEKLIKEILDEVKAPRI